MSTAAVPAIEASGLTKQFGAVFALDRVDLRVEQGESLAVFGPNGAGKTTLIRALTLGLRPRPRQLLAAAMGLFQSRALQKPNPCIWKNEEDWTQTLRFSPTGCATPVPTATQVSILRIRPF